MPTDLHDRLKTLLGHRFHYLDETWVLIDVLADADSVVLDRQATSDTARIQANAYGLATRRANATLTLPISDPNGEGYSQDLMLLLEGRIARTPPSSLSGQRR